MIKVRTPPRNFDECGEGHFGASRGSRTHNGIDYAAAANSEVLSPIWGFVTKLGYPYGDDLTYRYVEIASNGKRHRFFYVKPSWDMEKGHEVQTGDVIGQVQNIAKRYAPRHMVNHIHYEIKTLDGEFIDPEEYWSGTKEV